MAEHTKIQWADHTWNPWLGCTPVHTGCLHCYAQDYFRRFGIAGDRRVTSASNWQKPVVWNYKAREAGVRRRIFPSLCDPFEDWTVGLVDRKGQALMISADGCGSGDMYVKGCGYDRPGDRPVTLDFIRQDLFWLIDRTRSLDWILLTKRPENIRRMWRDGARRENAWLVYSASDQGSLEAGLLSLLESRHLSPVLGLSLEPLVGPIDVSLACGLAGIDDLAAAVDWVIVGGESGSKARPCQLEWIKDIVCQCQAAGVRCFVKQLGAHPKLSHRSLISWKWVKSPDVVSDGNRAFRIETKHPKGGDWKEWPEALRVRELCEAKK